MGFERSVHDGFLKGLERQRAQVQRTLERQRKQFRQEDEARAAKWLDHVQAHAARAGADWPQPVELALLRKLATIDGTFTAAQIGRNGWCGIRTTASASAVLERFVGNKWLFRIPPNRQGQTRYAFTRESALGSDHLGDRELWPTWLETWDFPDNRFTRGTGGKEGFNPLVAAGFIEGGSADEFQEATGEEFNGPGYDFCAVPNPDAECDLWAVARKLAWEEGTPLHRIAEGMAGLSPIQQAYAMAIAQDRVNPEFAPICSGRPTGWSIEQSNDPIGTHVRGIAEYLGVDYNALRAAVAAAATAIKAVSGKDPIAATQTPTVEI
jgi:hypothetical protein